MSICAPGIDFTQCTGSQASIPNATVSLPVATPLSSFPLCDISYLTLELVSIDMLVSSGIPALLQNDPNESATRKRNLNKLSDS